MRDSANFEIMKIDVEPKKFEIFSDIYVIYLYKKYVPVIDVIFTKNKRKYSLIIGASSFATALEAIRAECDGTLVGNYIWIEREF